MARSLSRAHHMALAALISFSSAGCVDSASGAGGEPSGAVADPAVPAFPGRVIGDTGGGGGDLRSDDALATATECTAGLTLDATGTCSGWLSAGIDAPRCTEHTLTRLADGRVLAVGRCGRTGADWEVSCAAGESFLFTPGDDSWAAISGPAPPLVGHTATALSSGAVLFAGGLESERPTARCLRFEADSTRWQIAAPLRVPRWGHSATRLGDGRVLVVGGYDSLDLGDRHTTASVELYDPSTDSWSDFPPLRVPRAGHSAIALDDGRVAIIGGYEESWRQEHLIRRHVGRVEIIDPASSTVLESADFSAVEGLSLPGPYHRAVGLDDGWVLVLGLDSPAGAAAVLFHPEGARWGDAGEPSLFHEDPAAVRLADGRVLVTPASIYSEVRVSELYDPATGEWAQTTPHAAYFDPAMVLLEDGRALLVGMSFDEHPAAEVYVSRAP